MYPPIARMIMMRMMSMQNRSAERTCNTLGICLKPKIGRKRKNKIPFVVCSLIAYLNCSIVLEYRPSSYQVHLSSLLAFQFPKLI